MQLGKIQEGIIGDGKYGKIRINTETTDKIFQKHWPFYLENLIATANNWDFVVENRWGIDGKINLIKQFSNNQGVILAGNIDADGVFSVTFYEPKNDIKTLVEKEIQKWWRVYTKGGEEIKNTSKITKISLREHEKWSYNSTGWKNNLGEAEIRKGENQTDFKLSERIKEVIKKLDTNYTRYTNSKAVGTFYEKSGNIAIRSINDIDVVHHELSHLIDIKQGIMENFFADAEVVEEMEKIYLEYYPWADISHDLDTKMREWYAVLQQKYLMIPTAIIEKYPLLVDVFVENGHPLQKQINADMSQIIADYQGLSAVDKIGAIVNNDKKNTEYNSFLNVAEKIEQKVSDIVIPFVKLEEKSGKKFDVANLLYASKAVNGRIFANIDNNGIDVGGSMRSWKIKRDQDFWHFNEKWELEQKEEYNWGALIKEVGDAKKCYWNKT